MTMESAVESVIGTSHLQRSRVSQKAEHHSRTGSRHRGRIGNIRNLCLPEMLDEKLGQNVDFAHQVLTRRPHDIHATRCSRKSCHDRYQHPGRIRFSQKVRHLRDAETSNGCGCQGNCVVRFEPALGGVP